MSKEKTLEEKIEEEIKEYEEFLSMTALKIISERKKKEKTPLLPYVEPLKKTRPDGKPFCAVIVNIPVHREFYFGNGVVTDDLETAWEAGWGDSVGGAMTFGYGDVFKKLDLDWLPEPEGKYRITIKTIGSWNIMLHYEDEVPFYKNIIDFPNDQFPETFTPGPASKPYVYSDQGTELRIFEKDGYIVFLDGSFPVDNLDDYNRFCAFKVPVEKFHKAWSMKEWI